MATVRPLVAVLLCGVLLSGCGETDRLADDVRARAQEVRKEARQLRRRAEKLSERVAERVRKILDDIEKAVPRAGPGTRSPSARGRTEVGTIDAFLTDVLGSVDEYWTRTLTASDLPEPRVSYLWVPPGDRVRSGCGAVADDRAAFYCPADDTIYLAQNLAARLYAGLTDDFPGQRAGYGRAVGDFGVAYIVAHEYAHNLQTELGVFAQTAEGSSKPFELQADCMAGLWGNSVYRAGKVKPGDIDEAMGTALAVGDFDYGNENHHGTPEERRDAWLTGFESGRPGDCTRFVDA